jgi:hypothetical protein
MFSLFKRKPTPKTSKPTEEITYVPEPILDTDPTIDPICQFIREEGYVPFKQSENLVVFKIQGETYGLHGMRSPYGLPSGYGSISRKKTFFLP